MGQNVIRALSKEAQLKRRVRRHLSKLGFQKEENGHLSPPSDEKSIVRSMHALQRISKLNANEEFISDNIALLKDSLASGHEIDPSRIVLSLRRIDAGTPKSTLFRLASLSWSIPVSNGFGRRLRYLVWDEYHDRLAGLIALGMDAIGRANLNAQGVFDAGISNYIGHDESVSWNEHLSLRD